MKKTIRNIIESKQKASGFTLVETLIYVVLFAILSVFLLNTLLIMLRSYTEVRVNDDILDAAHVSMERMTREIRGSISIGTATSGTLLLNTTNSGGTAITEQFDVASSTLEFKYNGTTEGNLTGAHVLVTSLIFRGITGRFGRAYRNDDSIVAFTNK